MEVLRGSIARIEKILSITHQPGVSIGVIHHGEQVFQHNFGVRDVVTGEAVNGDTMFCIASLTEAFVVTGLDILIREHGLSWDTRVSSILPEFEHKEKPAVYSEITLRDICSHRTGLASLDEITQGMRGRILLPKKEVVNICNALPIVGALRSRFFYNNALYALAGCVIERLSKRRTWGDFLNDRIFAKLGMERTTAFTDVHKTDDNIAKPYIVMTNGTCHEYKPSELSAESMNGASGGIRSSVNDLMKWSVALLKSFRETAWDSTMLTNIFSNHSAMFDRNTIVTATSPADGEYCSGWYHHQTPCKLAMMSPNRAFESPILGKDSPAITLYDHQGNFPGYTCTMTLVPETETAVVILSNATGHSDATDWIAQDMIQALHDLQPRIDFTHMASRAALKYLARYSVDYWLPLHTELIPCTQPPELSSLVGIYNMEGLAIVSIGISLDPDNDSMLLATICKQKDQVWHLWHYHHDVFCFLPENYDSCLSQGISAQLPEFFLIPFLRDTKNEVSGLRLNMKAAPKAIHFTKVG